MAELTFAGFSLTQADWDALDDEDRVLLLEALGELGQDEVEGEPYESYEVYIEELPILA